MKPTHAAILIASSAAYPFPKYQAQTIAGFLSSTNIKWLAYDRACAILFNTTQMPPDIITAIRLFLGFAEIDIIIIPAKRYCKKKLLFIDIDSVLADNNNTDELSEMLKIHNPKQPSDPTGGKTQATQLLERASMLEGLKSTNIKQALLKRIAFVGGIQTLVQTLKKTATKVVLISSGFTLLANVVGRYLHFDECIANALEISNTTLTGRIIGPIIDANGKVNAMSQLVEKYGLTLGETFAIGKNPDTLAMLKHAGVGIGFGASFNQNRYVINNLAHNDLAAMLYIQDYSRSEFVL